jgi:dipeptidase D
MHPADDLLQGASPSLLWRYFWDLSQIPRSSKHEEAAARWCVAEAEKLGCTVERDPVGNVLIRKSATAGMDHVAPVALQAHIDMVCEKNEDTVHDFLRDPLRLRRDGDRLMATGTTLGADNGIGVATALAVLADPEVRHGPLEVLLTIDEETGLTGAHHLRSGWLRATRVINLDSEEEGAITIGCAGGVDTVVRRTCTWQAPPAGWVARRIKVAGLKGGHSGIDIHQGRGNAIRVLATALDEAWARVPLYLATIQAGNKRNAIAREASAVVWLQPGDEEALTVAVAAAVAAWQVALGILDPSLHVQFSEVATDRAMAAADARATIDLLLSGPHGIEAMSPDIPGLVQTSTNLGLVALQGDTIEACFLTRSSIESSKRALTQRILAVARLAGFDAHQEDGYPGWKPEPAAPLLEVLQQAHVALCGQRMTVTALHAGLECGLIAEKYPHVQFASIGPDIRDAHTPEEWVSIPSVGRVWALLVETLQRA